MKQKLHILFYFKTALLFTFQLNISCSQSFDPVFKHFSIHNGLPSSEVYMVFQDSRGYIWLATDNGVCRFDGQKFRNFTTRDGLSDNVVFKIFEDTLGRVWFGTHSCRLSYYFQDSIYHFKYNNILLDTLPNNAILNSFHIDKNLNIYLALIDDGCFKISQKGELQHIHPDIMVYKGFGTYYVLEVDSKLLSFVSANIPWEGKERIYLKNEERLLKTTFEQNKMLVTRSNISTLKYNNIKYIALSKKLVEVDQNLEEFSYKFNHEILTLYEDNHKEAWVGFYKGGAGKLTIGKNSYSFLENYSVSSILQDHEGGYWFSTLEKGVYYIPDISVCEYSSQTLSMVGANVFCKDPDGNIFVGWQDGTIGVLNVPELQLQTITRIGPEKITCQVLDLLYQSPGKLWVGTVGDPTFITYKKERINNIEVIPLACPRLVNSGNAIWAGNAIGICKYEDQEIVYNTITLQKQIRVNCLLADTNDLFWVGSKNGLWQFYAENFFFIGKDHELLQYPVNDILKTRIGMIMGTEGMGVVIYNKDSVYSINKSDGLASENVNSIYAENDSTFLLATQAGVSMLEIIGPKKNVTNISERMGFSRQETSDAIISDNHILIAEKNGLRIIKNFKDFKPSFSIPIFIHGIQINQLDTGLRPSYDLPYHMNSINLDYKAISFKYADALKYRYRMSGLDTTWHTTSNQSVNYAALPPGNYQFEVTVAGFPELKHQTAAINFSISPPFWSTWWFISAVSIFIISLVSLVIYFRFRQIVNRGKLLQALNESQHKALSAQMNPHFIFNSLNSIHTYILQNKTDDSSKYLAKFAKLMRMVLDNSREHLITIKDELKALEFYLELEAMRFKGKVSYAIVLDEKINTDEIKIPPLLIQPYVENAIWHGLMHKEGSGFIEIRLSKKENEIICSITDDGIGRVKSTEIKKAAKEERKSVGMNITDQRISLIKSVHKINIGTTVSDRMDEKGNASGTRVVINIPVII